MVTLPFIGTFSLTSIIMGIVFFALFIIGLKIFQWLNIRWQSWKILKKSHEGFQDIYHDNLIKLFGEENIDKIKRLLEFRILEPVDRDPYNVMHFIVKNIRSARKRWRQIIREIFPDISLWDVFRYECVMSAGAAIRFLYVYLRHWILFAQRYKLPIISMQIIMFKEIWFEMLRMYEGALDAFEKNLPIGDGIGPMVVTELARRYGCTEWRHDPIDDVLYCSNDNIIFVRACEGATGFLGGFVQGQVFSKLITVDAGLKFLGTQTGSWYEGIGVVCGGEGSRYFMERRCEYTETIMFICRMHIDECLCMMSPEIAASVDDGIELIEEQLDWKKNPQAGKILVIGVGNATGIPVKIINEPSKLDE